MVASNDAPLGTAFTVSVDVRHGLTTGISCRAALQHRACARQRQHGRGGLRAPRPRLPAGGQGRAAWLMRSGHTEAAVDLCKLAGLPQVGVICELANRRRHGDEGRSDRRLRAGPRPRPRLPLADMIAYRQKRERLVQRLGTFPVETRHGERCGLRPKHHAPSIRCSTSPSSTAVSATGRNVLARLHRANVVSDSVRNRRAPSTARWMRFAAEGRGVLVYLREGTGRRAADLLFRRDRPFGGGAQQDLARGRSRRADPARPRGNLDAATWRGSSRRLCRAGGLRHRARGDGAAGG